MIFGFALIGLSLWGIALCQQLFQTYIVGPSPTSLDTSFAKLAGWVAWLVFFGPIEAAGLIVLSSTLRKSGALERLGALCEKWIPQEITSGSKPPNSRGFRGEEVPHDGLESLGDEKVAQLTKRAHQIAFLLGLFAGTFFVLLGIFGLMLESVDSQTHDRLCNLIGYLYSRGPGYPATYPPERRQCVAPSIKTVHAAGAPAALSFR